MRTRPGHTWDKQLLTYALKVPNGTNRCDQWWHMTECLPCRDTGSYLRLGKSSNFIHEHSLISGDLWALLSIQSQGTGCISETHSTVLHSLYWPDSSLSELSSSFQFWEQSRLIISSWRWLQLASSDIICYFYWKKHFQVRKEDFG